MKPPQGQTYKEVIKQAEVKKQNLKCRNMQKPTENTEDLTKHRETLGNWKKIDKLTTEKEKHTH